MNCSVFSLLPPRKWNFNRAVQWYTSRVTSKRLEDVAIYGLYDVESNDFRIPLDLTKAANILSEVGLFWEAAKFDILNQKLDAKLIVAENEKDNESTSLNEVVEVKENPSEEAEITIDSITDEEVAASLERVSVSVDEFFASKEIEDRIEVLRELDVVGKSKRGKLVLYLGGKNTGKSFTLQHFMNQHKYEIVYIDGRDGGDLSILLERGIPKDLKAKMIPYFHLIASTVTKVVSSVDNMFPKVTPTQLLEVYLSFDRPPGSIPTIIIDEANRFLTDAQQIPEMRLQIRDLLEFLAKATKQSNSCKVILTSSEYSFPFLLDTIGEGIFSTNASEKIYAGEIRPPYMYNTLTTKWKMGHHLASVFIACYGGHLWNCANALDALLSKKEIFKARSVLGSSQFSNVDICVNSKIDKMKDLLEEAAKIGFAPILNERDPRAEFGSLAGVIGVIDPDAAVVEIPAQYREGKRSGVVPYSQSMRLIIANVLQDYKYE
jgi:hypothetical protein